MRAYYCVKVHVHGWTESKHEEKSEPHTFVCYFSTSDELQRKVGEYFRKNGMDQAIFRPIKPVVKEEKRKEEPYEEKDHEELKEEETKIVWQPWPWPELDLFSKGFSEINLCIIMDKSEEQADEGTLISVEDLAPLPEEDHPVFVGIKAGEPFDSSVVFDREYAYLNFTESHEYDLLTTDNNAPSFLFNDGASIESLDLRSEPLDDGDILITRHGRLSLQNSRLFWHGTSAESKADEKDKVLTLKLTEVLPVPIPLLPEMIRSGILLCTTKDGFRYWLGMSFCIFIESHGMVQEYVPLTPDQNYHAAFPFACTDTLSFPEFNCPEMLSLDPHHNVFVARNYRFTKIPYQPCHCPTDSMSHLRLIRSGSDVLLGCFGRDLKGKVIGRVVLDVEDPRSGQEFTITPEAKEREKDTDTHSHQDHEEEEEHNQP